MADSDDILNDLSPGPEEEREGEDRPDPDSDQQQEELDAMLDGTDSASGETSGSSDPTDVVSDSPDDEGDNEPDAQDQIQEDQEEALADLQGSDEDEGDSGGVEEETESAPQGDSSAETTTEVGARTVEEVLESQGVDSVGELARQYQTDFRTGVPSICEYGCNIQPDETCPHGYPSVIEAADE